MTTTELFKELTENQKKEFSKDLEQMVNKVKAGGYLDSNKVFETNGNMRLDNDKVLLNANFFFRIDENGNVSGTVRDIKKFDSVDEYLDSINEVNDRNPNDWIKLK
ncbi:hypothetical protein [Flagellimonas sp.]|uniref:hypothetical protein n=1 Tax=Flagellimonas sp. TaxID=2058762 RepID=UPI003BA863ED